MTPQDIIDIINDYEELVSHTDCRLRRIIPNSTVTRISTHLSDENLEIHYRKDWNDDLDDYEIELPVEFLLAETCEESDAIINKYFEEKRKKELEKYAKEKEERERAEYERLKKYEKEEQL